MQLARAPKHWLEKTGSTNDDARQLAHAGETGPLWIAARRQTAGRGRQGRAWVSREGNLYATLLWRPEGGIAGFPSLSFVAAIAVLRTAEHFLGEEAGAELALKWPNDVLLQERKLAGILLEAEQDKKLGDWLALGIGINLAHAPENTPFPATNLASFTPPPDPEDALVVLAEKLAELAALWQSSGGMAEIHKLWLARAWRVGKEITVRLRDETFSGIFAGLDESGALELRPPNAPPRYISAGDVFFPTPSDKKS